MASPSVNNTAAPGNSLADYYKRWEVKAKALSAGVDDDRVGAEGTVSDWANLRPEDIGVHIGRPLSEAEFAAHRARGAQVVTRRPPGGAPADK